MNNTAKNKLIKHTLYQQLLKPNQIIEILKKKLFTPLNLLFLAIRIIKKVAKILIEPIISIINLSFERGVYAEQFKLAEIISIDKANDGIIPK